MSPSPLSPIDEALAHARRTLIAARSPGGWWEGELSSSSLSTATAVFALHLVTESRGQDTSSSESNRSIRSLVDSGLKWLADHQNADGGWGDTTLSFSNISTTALCWAALSADRADAPVVPFAAKSAAEAWLTSRAGGVDPAHLVPAIIARYGKDKTFSVPILTMCALAGKLGTDRDAWRHIPQLPFELAAVPQRWFKWMRLPVVSYALPALIAIGLVRHRKRWWEPMTWMIRRAVSKRTLSLLEKIQPTGGGFLEATPLTSFVVMSLAGAGEAGHPIVQRGVEFLIRAARTDGSWAIDTNLATWVTSLAINALATGGRLAENLGEEDQEKVRHWLLNQQYRTEHPYTLADAGGWAWTDLPGGVPDADDTPGALLALAELEGLDRRKQADFVGSAPRTVSGFDEKTNDSQDSSTAELPLPCTQEKERGEGPVSPTNIAPHPNPLPRVQGRGDRTAVGLGGSAQRHVASVDDEMVRSGEHIRDVSNKLPLPCTQGRGQGEGHVSPTDAAPHPSPLPRVLGRGDRTADGLGRSAQGHVSDIGDEMVRSADPTDAKNGRSNAVTEQTLSAAHASARWLMNLQNRDGGIPTFCRGWGKLPFDRSSADLTAHTIRAWLAWWPYLSIDLLPTIRRAVTFLRREQLPDGSWMPLWFGNQHATDDVNPVYGTAKVLRIVGPLTEANLGIGLDANSPEIARSVQFLLNIQNADGGWGGAKGTPSSIEETALVIESLATLPAGTTIPDCSDALRRAVAWLVAETEGGTRFDPSPIGFYFAKLWYFEKLYPLVFAVGAMEAIAKRHACI